MWASIAGAQAAERHADFLHALQQRGYGDLAVFYMQSLSAAKPESLSAVWDLEMANSLRIAAAEARTLSERQSLERQAETHLNAHAKQYPNDPGVLNSLNAWGTISLDRGMTRAGLGNEVRASTPIPAKIAERSQADFDEATRYFQESLRRHDELAKKLAEADESTTQRLSGALVETKLRLSLADYWRARLLAAGQPTPPAPATELFQKAAEEFQKLRTEFESEQAGIVAGYWQARCLAEVGENKKVIAVCDEVLQSMPQEGDDALPAELQFFAEVVVLRLQSLAKDDRDGTLIADANRWVKAHAKQDRAPGSEAVVFELAKAQLREAERLTGDEKQTARISGLKLLAKVAALPGAHQYAALKLYRAEQAGKKPVSPKDGLTYARLAEQNQNWPEVEAAFADVLQGLGNSKAAGDVKLADVQEALAAARQRHAQALFAAGDDAQAQEIVDKVLKEQPKTAAAPKLAALALASIKREFLQAEESKRLEVLDRLTKLSEKIIKTWPKRSEADDARLTMAQSTAVSGNIDEAVRQYRAIPPESLRYRVAQLTAGQLLWRRHQDKVRRAAKDEPAAPEASEDLKQAEELIRAAVGPNGVPLKGDEVSAEASVLLAQLLLERNAADEARQLLAPLVAQLGEGQLATPSPLTLRLVHTAARADMAAGDTAAIEALALRLARVAGDVSETNNVLVDLLRQLSPKFDASAATRGDQSPAIRELAELLVTRQQLSPLAMLIVADACRELDPRRATELLQGVLNRVESEPALQKTLSTHLPRARSQLIDLLCEQRQFVPALKYIDEQLAARPRQLDLWMEKGRILQNCAAGDAKYLEPALAHWTEVRRNLGTRRGAEYFEAGYFAAFNLYRIGQNARTPEKLDQAEQMLKAILVTAPKLSGEPMVKQYQELLDKIKQARTQENPKAA